MKLRVAIVVLLAVASAFSHASPLGPDGQAGHFHPGKFIWFDLATDDPAGARKFYGAVFGWRFRQTDGGPSSYMIIEHAGGKVGGLFFHARPPRAPVGSRWLSLMAVRDVAKTASEVRQRGGEVVLAPVTVPGRGTHALFRDPQGAVFGVLAAVDGDPPDNAVDDGEVFWLDLFTTDPSRASAFYSGIAGYEVSESDALAGRKRRVLATEGIARAGIVALRPDTFGPGWLPYILVDDVHGTLKRALAAGGKVVVEPRADLLDGNLAVIADPNGGVVGVVDWLPREKAEGPVR
ncbi:MAG: VOC family protein [Betaproteobacteria bacterium]|nr:VOC family protein [Betaproteobacteria bacterium]